ncbi:glycosyltransferase [Butyrivibrio sp. INlla14]|uniref:glycosyltransferase n=1 Tax=Butyrivibrio sp. INlla14 TaxID=1520808 RepID=UPI0008772043|nr:glycosyltransferase [Butyrivibrio sp. INlla14]SCY27733.1 Glycosyltransferase involved in cell wall bisynthesis [Butyrivibrio sp. INlla14]
MNICLLNDSFPPVIDGVANVVMNYGSILTTELESNVIVGTPRYPDASYDGYPYKVVAYPSFDTTDFVKGYRTGYPLSIREIDQMADMKPDIIHTHCPAASTIMGRILRRETGAPLIFTYHTKFDVDIARAVGDGLLKKETIKTMVKNIEACDDVWVVSEGAGENLRSLGFQGEYRVMPNGVDFPKGRASLEAVKELQNSYDIPVGIPLFLFVGRLMKYKGLPIIIDAMKELSTKGIDYRMVFVGGGADADEMQALVKEYGISDKVIFTGPVRDREKLRAWNTRADLFLFPSTYDTNGIVVREAAACGLASVLIKGSCAAEGITHDRNGYLIEENAQSMAALLELLSGNLDRMHQVGQNAMDEIYISWDQAVRIAYDRYKEIHEMAKSGELGIRKHQSFEYLMNSAADILNGTQRVFVDIPREIHEGMRENYEEFRINARENYEEFRSNARENYEEFKDNVRDNYEEFKGKVSDNLQEMKGNMEDFKQDFRENVESIKSDINDGIDRLKDNITGDFSDDKYDDT